jgi:class 3 adenylate cyclase
VGLGSKLVSEPYNENDKELLDTLVNNLVVALKNARSFEQIKLLNEDLQAKNIKLEKALRKVEILEDVKANLSKFVPNTVTRLIEKSPNGIIPESKEQDVSVLFLDIEGYTKMCEELEGSEVNAVIEHCFSVFMDAIFANNGDINETAGDGLMVLFLNEDKMTNALEAVRTALKIKEEAARIKSQFKSLSAPLIINMGINSGPALVGAAKFDSYTGSRWTYTARGSVTNVAARIGAQASDGKILLSKTTADRVKVHFSLNSLGRFHLKNVTEEIEIFQV